MTRTYIIGHVNPDTDSIASAMAMPGCYASVMAAISSPPAPAHQPADHLGLRQLWPGGAFACSMMPPLASSRSPAAWIQPTLIAAA